MQAIFADKISNNYNTIGLILFQPHEQSTVLDSMEFKGKLEMWEKVWEHRGKTLHYDEDNSFSYPTNKFFNKFAKLSLSKRLTTPIHIYL